MIMSNEQRVSNEQIDRKLESFVEITLQKMIDLHEEIKVLKKKVHDQQVSFNNFVAQVGYDVEEKIGIE